MCRNNDELVEFFTTEQQRTRAQLSADTSMYVHTYTHFICSNFNKQKSYHLHSQGDQGACSLFPWLKVISREKHKKAQKFFVRYTRRIKSNRHAEICHRRSQDDQVIKDSKRVLTAKTARDIVLLRVNNSKSYRKFRRLTIKAERYRSAPSYRKSRQSESDKTVSRYIEKFDIWFDDTVR